jgi:hypothetical protein
VFWAGAAFAGTITTPTAPFVVPLNTAGTGPAPFKIVGAGYSSGTNVETMICDGLAPTAPAWDIGVDCDINTAPPAQPVQSNGTATWDPSLSKNQQIGVFEGDGPNNLFNCYYPGELDHGVAYSNGQIDPNDGNPSWTNCQVRVASTNGAATTDQAFATITLQKPGSTGTTTTTVVSGTTTSTSLSPSTSTTLPTSSTTSTTSTTAPTSSTTTSTTTTVTGTSTTTTSTTAAGTTTTTTTTTVAGTTTSSSDPQGSLPVTGLDADWLALIGIGLITVGVIAKSRRQA